MFCQASPQESAGKSGGSEERGDSLPPPSGLLAELWTLAAPSLTFSCNYCYSSKFIFIDVKVIFVAQTKCVVPVFLCLTSGFELIELSEMHVGRSRRIGL